MHHLTADQARRIAIRAQLLTARRPTDLLALVHHMGFLQWEPTPAVAPSAEVVAWSRLGSATSPDAVSRATDGGELIMLRSLLRPAEDLALFRDAMAAWPGPGPLRDWQVSYQGWVEANDDCRRDILAKLYDEGPLPRSALPDTTLVPWQSSGWNNDRNVRKLLDLMVQRGEVAQAGFDGREPLWDLAERIYPDDPVVPHEDALQILARRRLSALGISRVRRAAVPVEPDQVPDVGEPARIEGLRGTWRVAPELLDDDAESSRVALLSPLDQLIFDRKRMEELFGFDYQLEMYKPVAKRRWGYWAMPILIGDELVGKLDATADRRAGILRINAVHEDRPFSQSEREAVELEISSLGEWLDLHVER